MHLKTKEEPSSLRQLVSECEQRPVVIGAHFKAASSHPWEPNVVSRYEHRKRSRKIRTRRIGRKVL